MDAFAAAEAAAERALASMALRAILAREALGRPEVDGITFECTLESPGLVVTEVTLTSGGRPVEGFSL